MVALRIGLLISCCCCWCCRALFVMRRCVRCLVGRVSMWRILLICVLCSTRFLFLVDLVLLTFLLLFGLIVSCRSLAGRFDGGGELFVL